MNAEALDLKMPIVVDDDARDIHPTSDGYSKNGQSPVICYRDPADVRTIRRQSRLLILSLAIVGIAVVGVVYKAIQKPDRIVVDMTSGRAVMINDRELGATEAVKLEKDKLQIADMITWLRLTSNISTESISDRVPRISRRRSD